MAENNAAGRRPECKYLRDQAQKIATHLDGAKTARQVEDVHQVRVASRRLRAALRLFGSRFDSRLVDRWQQQMKKLQKRLGKARDLDVQILYLEAVLDGPAKKQKALRPGIERMLLRRRQERQKTQKSVLRAIERLEDSGALARMQRETEAPANEISETSGNAMANRLRQQAEDYLTDVESQLTSLDDERDAAGHHELRIAVKRLRYTLEIAGTVFDVRLKKQVKQLKRMQTLLGDLHDCDVWVEAIERFRDEERQRTLDYFGHTRPFGRLEAGLDFLRDQRLAQRRELFAQAAGQAEAMRDAGAWDAIRNLFRAAP